MAPKIKMPTDAELLAAVGGQTREAWLLRRLAHWHRYTRIRREGHLWIVKSRAEWAEETGLSEDQVKRALAALRFMGLVVTEQHHWGQGGTPNYARLTEEAKQRLWGRSAPPGECRSAPPAGGAEVASPGGAEVHHPIDTGKNTEKQKEVQAAGPPQGGEVKAGEILQELKQKQAAATTPEALEAAVEGARTLAQHREVWGLAWQASRHDCVPPWSTKRLNQLSQLLSRLPAGGGARILLDVITYWGDFANRAKEIVGLGSPNKPDIGYLLSRSDVLMDWWTEHAQKDAGACAGSAPKFELEEPPG